MFPPPPYVLHTCHFCCTFSMALVRSHLPALYALPNALVLISPFPSSLCYYPLPMCSAEGAMNMTGCVSAFKELTV